MNLVKTIAEVRIQVKQWKSEGLTIGFVPTMGFLHEGHQSLVEKAHKENDKVIVSIFVNPTQFGPSEDLDRYPKDLENDKVICEKAGADLIFAPEVSEMYIENATTYVDMSGLTEGLCGEKRPGHFRGVCLVVAKLFNIVTPHKAYFGEKDAQQLAVIKKMSKDLNFDIEIIGCPIVREKDGLAKSSRNTYLSPSERNAALILNQSLKLARESFSKGERNAAILINLITNNINTEIAAKIDYVAIVDAFSLKPISIINTSTLIAIAVFIGKTRLIDNITLEA